MTAHEGHDHPNTKTGRAACRRAVALSVEHHPAGKARQSKTPKPTAVSAQRKATQKIEREVVSEILTTPHEFNPHDKIPTICLNCGKSERSKIHHDGPTDLSDRFNF